MVLSSKLNDVGYSHHTTEQDIEVQESGEVDELALAKSLMAHESLMLSQDSQGQVPSPLHRFNELVQ